MGNLLTLFACKRYARKVLSTRPIAYWVLGEASGTVAYDASGNARHGTHTGVDLGLPGIGDGRTAPFYDGANDFTNIYSASLAGAFNGAEGTLMVWMKAANAGVWTDGTERFLGFLRADGNNVVRIAKPTTANLMRLLYIAGGTSKTVDIACTAEVWQQLALSWSRSAGANGEVRAYLNGAQSGSILTSLGTWVGALASNSTLLGSNFVAPVNVWHGNLGHAAVWSRALTPAEIAALAQVN